MISLGFLVCPVVRSGFPTLARTWRRLLQPSAELPQLLLDTETLPLRTQSPQKAAQQWLSVRISYGFPKDFLFRNGLEIEVVTSLERSDVDVRLYESLLGPVQRLAHQRARLMMVLADGSREESKEMELLAVEMARDMSAPITFQTALAYSAYMAYIYMLNLYIYI